MLTKRMGIGGAVAASLWMCWGSMAAGPVSIIVDTDVGSDDLMAIAFLLARKDVRIEALTVVNGLAHVRAGADNLLRLLELSGHAGIPVYQGSERPLGEAAPFPEEWRRTADRLPGVTLPPTKRRPEAEGAVEFLARRLHKAGHPVTILALGPLTNLAEAFRREPAAAANAQRIVMMGGAVRVPGNVDAQPAAEWNFYADPLAAQRVFQAGAKIDLVPLDATGKVPIDMAFLKSFQRAATTPLARFVGQVLESDRANIEAGIYQAWDPLAAVAAIDGSAVSWTPLALDIRADGAEAGRSVEALGRPANARVALTASREEFMRVFLSALQ